MDAAPLLIRLLQAFDAARLETVLIGNAAAAIHGAPVTTLDFDFMFRATPTNLRKLKAVAAALGAVILRPYYPVSNLYRMVDDATGLQADFMPAIHGVRSFEGLRTRPPLPRNVPKPVAADLEMPAPKKKISANRRKALAALARESDRQLDDLIRRRIAMPLEQRMHFLRRRLPGGGSSL
jgi:hypothetical protein